MSKVIETERKRYKRGDIVQVPPELDWGPCLVIVDEVRSWGIQGYTSIPRGGDAYIRLEWGEFEHTGGQALWVTEDDD